MYLSQGDDDSLAIRLQAKTNRCTQIGNILSAPDLTDTDRRKKAATGIQHKPGDQHNE